MILAHHGIEDPHCFPRNLKAFNVVEKAVDFTCALHLPCSSLLPSLYTYDMTTVAFWCRILWRNHANHCLLMVSSILRCTWVCDCRKYASEKDTLWSIKNKAQNMYHFSSFEHLWSLRWSFCKLRSDYCKSFKRWVHVPEGRSLQLLNPKCVL